MSSAFDSLFNEDRTFNESSLINLQNKFDEIEKIILCFEHLRNCSNNQSFIDQCTNKINELNVKKSLIFNSLPRSLIFDD